MKAFLSGVLATLAVQAAVLAWYWYANPEALPQEWRRANPHSRDYTPTLYRWKDAGGATQLTDTPPRDRPYETIRVEPAQNTVPAGSAGPGERPPRG